MRFSRITAAIAAAALLLSGCASLSLNGPDILTPPKAAGSRAELQRMLEKDAGGAYALLYPSYGEYKSGMILYDLDHDGTEEAVALYTAADGTARVLLAAQDNDSYTLIGSEELSSASISSLYFADLNADGVDELLIGCDAATPLAVLSAFLIEGGVTRVDVAAGFTDYTAGDFDGDAAADILLFQPQEGDTAAQAALTVYDNGAFIRKAACDIDPDVVSYRRIRCGRISEDIYGVTADGITESGAYTTQLVYYDPTSQALINPLFSLGGYAETTRYTDIAAFDIDGDDIVELPLLSAPDPDEDGAPAQICGLIHWCNYDTSEMTPLPKLDTVLCDELGFLFAVKPGLTGTVTARRDGNTVALYRSDEQGDELLLTVKFYEKGTFDSSLIAEAVISESNAGVYTYVPGSAPEYTEEEVKYSFMLTDHIS